MHTKDVLAAELLQAGLPELAAKAKEGYYHDFLSPLDFPAMQLAADLIAAGTPAADEIRQRLIEGEFDASIEESNDWADSDDGQNTFHALMGDRSSKK